MIYVTLGTMFMPFTRLVSTMDAIAVETGEEVVLQQGLDTTPAPHCSTFDFKPHEECLAMQREARLIVAHAGIGATTDALAVQKPFLLVPRLKRYDEHMNDHQLEIAQAAQDRGWARMILDMDELREACAAPPDVPEHYTPAKAGLITALEGWVQHITEDGGEA